MDYNHFAVLSGNGRLDRSFTSLAIGFTGASTFTSGLVSNIGVHDILQLDNQKYLLLGSMTSSYNVPLNNIIRLNSDLTFDNTFTNLSFSTGGIIYGGLQQPSKDILLYGDFTSGDYSGRVYRDILQLNSNGVINITFPPVAISPIPIMQPAIYGAISLPLSSVLLCGTFSQVYNLITNEPLKLGLLQTGISVTQGTSAFDITNISDRMSQFNIYTVTVTEAGEVKIGIDDVQVKYEDLDLSLNFLDGVSVIGGGSNIVGPNFDPTRMTLYKMNNFNAVDTTFEDLDIRTSTNSQFCWVSTLCRLRDGKVMAGGYHFQKINGNTNYHRIFRLNPDLTLDTTFPPLTTNEGVTKIYQHSNGEIYVGGAFTTVRDTQGALSRAYICKLNEDGTFNRLWSNLGTLNWTVQEIAEMPNGDLLLGGNFTSPRRNIIRIRTNGTWDTTFTSPITSTSSPAVVRTIHVINSNKIAIGGNFFIDV